MDIESGTQGIDMVEQLILVNNADQEVGHSEKIAAHRHGLLHRAFSVFIFDEQGRLLLQQRAAGKYHSAGLWTNTCCGHPRPGEAIEHAASRRLQEEMGLDCRLQHVAETRYRETFDNGLTEHEYDHIFIGLTRQQPRAAPEEAADWQWQPIPAVRANVAAEPELFTVWFRKIIEDPQQFNLEDWSRQLRHDS